MASVYSAVIDVASVNEPRLNELITKFSEKYGEKPSYISRAPGRVNLIGEHIDYMGYGVLPMAIEQDIIIAGRTNSSSQFHISNVKDTYKDHVCPSLVNNTCIDLSAPQWYDYVICGYLGIVEHLKTSVDQKTGLDLMVCGSIPPSAGLSSSSALVCASALITLQLVGGAKLSKGEMAQICCDCERYIGTQGGGMDQSISFLAEKGKAKMIEFDPIRASDVTLPEGHVFVISHCLAELNKAATSHFNQRVVECRLACQIIAKMMGLSWQSLRRLGDLQAKLGKSLSEMIDLVKEKLHEEAYTKEEVLQLLGVKADELVASSLSANTAHLTEFRLYQRAHHVFTEAWRVTEFKKVADQPPVNAAKLGKLMNDSHVSTRDVYECSHPDLDMLTDLCRESGALGSRLTGAGWGGCAVSLVPEQKVDQFLKKVSAGFYTDERLKGRPLHQVLFKTAPAAGACLYRC